MRIGEVANQTGLSISNIRFYEKKGLINPEREQDSKYRDYIEEDVLILKEIVLYRKMNFSIDMIKLIVNQEISLEEALEKQLSDLEQQQKKIQGSIDLCNKMKEDEAFLDIDVEQYLNYVKEEEASGKQFADLDEFLEDFVEFTKFDHFVGSSQMGWFLFRYPWMNKCIVFLWLIFWVVIPIIGIVDDCMDENGVSPHMTLFWILWVLFFGMSFWKYHRIKND